jgi:glutamine synthetase
MSKTTKFVMKGPFGKNAK